MIDTNESSDYVIVSDVYGDDVTDDVIENESTDQEDVELGKSDFPGG